MTDTEQFEAERRERLDGYSRNTNLISSARAFLDATISAKYSYNFDWLSRPVIQYPQDIVAFQELVFKVKPDLIIETGIARGGSLILSASLLAMLDYAEARQNGRALDPLKTQRKVLGLDIDIRPHNREAIENHFLSNHIEMIEGSSVSTSIIDAVHMRARSASRVLVCLDSDHTHQHVLAELRAFAPLVSRGSYCIVFDTVVELLADKEFTDRPWGGGNNPLTAATAYLTEIASTDARGADGHSLNFSIDTAIDAKLLLSVAHRGYLRRN